MLGSTTPRRYSKAALRSIASTGAASGARKAGQQLERGSPVVARVLRATIEELARIGYGALSIEDVANRAGVNKTTVYRRWPTKAELVRAALRSMGDERVCEVSTGSLRGDLMAVGRSIILFAKSPEGRSILRMLLAEGMEPELAEIAASLRREREANPRALVHEAVARGELAPGTDAVLLMETLFGAIVQRLFFSHETVDDAFVERIVDLLLTGVARPAKARRAR
jgi:AcrR family transcriptional regulator